MKTENVKVTAQLQVKGKLSSYPNCII